MGQNHRVEGKVVMTFIWNAKFWCEKCQLTITIPIHFLSHIEEPSEEEKNKTVGMRSDAMMVISIRIAARDVGGTSQSRNSNELGL
jgi:hypothetical protein